jgi:hypothetical protein
MTEEELNEQVRQQRDDDLRTLLGTKPGRRVLFALINNTGTFDSSFTGNSGSFFNDGRKSVGQALFHEVMRLDAGRFLEMWQEHQTAEAQAEAKLDEQED